MGTKSQRYREQSLHPSKALRQAMGEPQASDYMALLFQRTRGAGLKADSAAGEVILTYLSLNLISHRTGICPGRRPQLPVQRIRA